jgi:hypothetical protein
MLDTDGQYLETPDFENVMEGSLFYNHMNSFT